ncbi:MAG: alcohol dehydrogenase catalytic domain-containing protein [Nitrospirae bacterium]|nr:alcohol dehydrogenase catalytic domain-containing protein [Nitrospirota bacterium]MBF0535459.1 alcohol dehydrogenase catalytic domain-containing protein [Nitrospirota bacterium]MBF0617647.1 alcohol dehydrogenase catalytic domain-containing protein [Nitrospirota bacterium]
MKALVVEAQWEPLAGYLPTEKEILLRRASVGSQVWRKPVFEIREVPVPDTGDNEVLIRVKRCGICGSDTHIYEHDKDGYILFSGPARFPCIIGHEYSGVVERVGKNVDTLRPGDIVAAESIHWCGKCTPCRSGAFNQCQKVELIGITKDGALAEFICAKERHCWKIDSLRDRYSEDDVFSVGALIEPIGCAYNGIFISGGGFKPGITVVVYGVGPIGLAAAALSRLSGASLILAFDTINERLSIAKSMGADKVYNINELKKTGLRPRDIVMEQTKGVGAEVQVESAGAAPFTVPEMENSLAVNGKIIYLGRAAASVPLMLDTLVSGANSIIGARGHAGYGIYNNVIRLIASGRLNIKEMITSTYDFTDAIGAIKNSTTRTDGKSLVFIS